VAALQDENGMLSYTVSLRILETFLVVVLVVALIVWFRGRD